MTKTVSRGGVSIVFSLAVLATPCPGDVITDWNSVLLQTIRETGGPPCPISRALVMMHVAMYDAVNSIDRSHEKYLSMMNAPAGASKEAAAAAAAHRVLTTIFPLNQSTYDTALATSLAAVPDGPNENAGVVLGRAVADALISARANDGTQGDPPYQFGNHPGDYQPTYPDFTAPPFNPGWGDSEPWCMHSGDQFRPNGPLNFHSMPNLLRSVGYALQVNEVKSRGARYSATRTDEQTDIAFFWANDLNGTFKPPGHLNHITQVVSHDRNLRMIENARLFALINLAMADAGLVAWDAKYNTSIDLWRPISAIRFADTDQNPFTIADPNWEPLNAFTPAFPSYVSGHATFAAAHAAVMMDFFGTDQVTFTIDTDDPNYHGAPRTYHRFSQAAWENALSRIYLGVHFRFDAVDGRIAGSRLGHFVFHHELQPICGPDGNNNAR